MIILPAQTKQKTRFFTFLCKKKATGGTIYYSPSPHFLSLKKQKQKTKKTKEKESNYKESLYTAKCKP